LSPVTNACQNHLRQRVLVSTSLWERGHLARLWFHWKKRAGRPRSQAKVLTAAR
jgi:hypothetical protein